jgi:hypothetical protein
MHDLELELQQKLQELQLLGDANQQLKLKASVSQALALQLLVQVAFQQDAGSGQEQCCFAMLHLISVACIVDTGPGECGAAARASHQSIAGLWPSCNSCSLRGCGPSMQDATEQQ